MNILHPDPLDFETESDHNISFSENEISNIVAESLTNLQYTRDENTNNNVHEIDIPNNVDEDITSALTSPSIFNQQKETANVKENCNYAQVSEKKPLMCCINATRIFHKCVFAICAECWNDIPTERPSRSRTMQRRKEDRNKDMCDHTNLKQECDLSYFTDNYQQSLTRSDYFPTKCTKCKKSLDHNTTNNILKYIRQEVI